MNKYFLTLLMLITSVANTKQKSNNEIIGMSLSTDGTGQVLIFPYYTVNNGFDTLMSITNTTNQAKGLRVRFREAANSREVFTFNLYLGAYDVWTGALVKSNDITEILSIDTSCTYPEIKFSETDRRLFNNAKYTGDFLDYYGDENKRMHEGFIEIIEMGVLTGESELATIIDPKSQEANCSVLLDAWDKNSSNPYWISDTQADFLPPTGGVTGEVILINVNEGIAVSEDATAVKGFSKLVNHFDVTSDSPNFNDGILTATLNNNGSPFFVQSFNSFEVLSVLLMKYNLANDFIVTDSIGAQTEWIITMPTRQYHVDPLYSSDLSIYEPFTEHGNSRNCEEMNFLGPYSREGNVSRNTMPLPLPPPSPEFSPSLCFSSNTLVFQNNYETNNPSIFSSNYSIVNATQEGLSPIYIPTTATNDPLTFFDTGWFELELNNVILSSETIKGLPVIGFAVQKFSNGQLADNTLANYAGIFNHDSSTFYQLYNDSRDSVKLENPQPMHIAEDDRGQVLIYPYYTVLNELDTLLLVKNTSEEAKAVKVRFLEGKNNRECLSFNLYLPANDSWSGALTKYPSSLQGYEGQESVRIVSVDKSCSSPNIIHQSEFTPYSFVAENTDNLGELVSRCTEGHIEIFEMGTLTATDLDNITQDVDGIPANCQAIDNNWSDSGKWFKDPTEDLLPPDGTGGLSGFVHLINVSGGVDFSYNATAIANFNTEIIHSNPGSNSPNLSSGNIKTTRIKTNDSIYKTIWNSSIDAVSALFMQTEVSNNFIIDESIGAQTEWVNMYPTIQFYTDPTLSGSENPIQPFDSVFTDGAVCDDFRFKAYDRAQNINHNVPFSVDPAPPNYNGLPLDCWSVNVSRASTYLATQSIFASRLNILGSNDIYTSISDLPFKAGWMTNDYNDENFDPSILIGTGLDGDIHTIFGKPILGFTAQKYINGTLSGGNVLANYAVIIQNKNKKRIEVTPKPILD